MSASIAAGLGLHTDVNAFHGRDLQAARLFLTTPATAARGAGNTANDLAKDFGPD
jgi:hypothetical protein